MKLEKVKYGSAHVHLRFRFQEIGLGGKQSENDSELSPAVIVCDIARFFVGLAIPENEVSRREEILCTCFRTGFRHKLPCYDA